MRAETMWTIIAVVVVAFVIIVVCGLGWGLLAGAKLLRAAL